MDPIFLSIGTGPGIGLQTAIRFAREGFHPVLTARHPDRLASLAEELRQATGRTADVARVDAGDPRQIIALAERYGQNVSVLHYNAAIVRGQSLAGADYRDLDEDIRAGVSGALYALKAFAPGMLDRQAGTLLLTGGVLALHPFPEYLTLGIAKAGIRNMTEALFAGFAERNVHIATVTVSSVIAPRSPEAKAVADRFWNIHCQPQSRWTWEEVYSKQ
ncbi:MAG: SDR family NAD(P)-dependent oxidoreductase [Desulfovibrionaceae bacterium]|nr:SDR family NAD(P)-dependent oxidoreductase [Desulfovibrionaceae bacterium]